MIFVIVFVFDVLSFLFFIFDCGSGKLLVKIRLKREIKNEFFDYLNI